MKLIIRMKKSLQIKKTENNELNQCEANKN